MLAKFNFTLGGPLFAAKPKSPNILAHASREFRKRDNSHSNEYYEQRLRMVAPNWEEHLKDDVLLLKVLDKIDQAGDQSEYLR
jgi:hypothetical protein